MNRRRAMVLAVCGALLVGGWWYFVGPSSRRPPESSLRELLSDIAGGQSQSALQGRSAAARDWAGSLPVLLGMLDDDNWRLRAVACEVISARADSNLVVLLIPRASDADWHVRAAAFEALARVRPLGGPAPMTNTPLAEREEVLLGWIAAGGVRSSEGAGSQRRDSASPRPLAGELCEIYANASHVEFGRPLIDRCLSCHAGAAPQPFEAGAACAECHPAIHQRWAGSAHANSLSHVRLITVDPSTRSPQVVDFGAVKGIGCTECHPLDPPRQAATSTQATTPASTTATASRPAACPYTFSAAHPAGDSCRRCHASTYDEWQSWQSRPHPKRLDWPPAQIDSEARGDRRTCVDCHMPSRGLEELDRAKDHAWSARRAPAFLREGADVRVAWDLVNANAPVARIELTNLAGHDCPTGSRRRALRLYAGSADGNAGGSLATLSPDRPGQLFLNARPSLAPGETRSFPLNLPAGAAAVRYQLRYYRNLADANGYTADVLVGQEPVDR